jgi:glycyl-tRNA synthetase beta chain/uncharacterized protein
VLVLADKAASLGDFRQYVRGLLNGSSQQTRRRLELSDPYFRGRPPRRPRHRLLRRPLLDRSLRQRRQRTRVEH